MSCLYLFARISVAMNGTYTRNFWPQFEFFLATRTFDPQHGFKHSRERVFIQCIQSLVDNPEMVEAMFQRWGDRNVSQATSILANNDIQLARLRDKELLLPILVLYSCPVFLSPTALQQRRDIPHRREALDDVFATWEIGINRDPSRNYNQNYATSNTFPNPNPCFQRFPFLIPKSSHHQARFQNNARFQSMPKQSQVSLNNCPRCGRSAAPCVTVQLFKCLTGQLFNCLTV